MSIEKNISVDVIEVVESGFVQVRTAIKIIEDGKEIGRTFYRHSVSPGDDYSQEDVKVQSICAVVHTAEVIAAYQAAQKAARLHLEG